MARSEKGQSRLPLLLMAAGGVLLAAAVLWVVFGGKEKKVDPTVSLANRCAFPACRAAANPGQARGYEGPSVAVNPKDENHVIVTDANMLAAHCGWHVTFDRGREWTDGVFQMPAGYTGCHINGQSGGHVPTGPSGVSFGPSGTVYATFGSADRDQGSRESVLLATSTDGGKNFRTAVAVRPEGDDLSFARPHMSVVAGPTGADRILLSFWQCRQGGRFCDISLFARSDDGGITFTPPIVINDPIGGQTPSEPLQTPDGTIYITYARRYADGPSDLILARSADAGATYTYSTVDSQIQIGDRYDPGKLAFDARSNALYLVYSDARTGTQQVIFRKSTDAGKTWSPPIGLAPQSVTGASKTPSISIAPNGRIDIVYYRTFQADTDNVYWAYSVDAGNRFVTRQVNDTPIRRYAYNNAIGNWYPPDVASLDGAALVTWSDSRNAPDQDANTQDVFLRRMLPAGVDGDLPP
jgi:hypothetical protein